MGIRLKEDFETCWEAREDERDILLQQTREDYWIKIMLLEKIKTSLILQVQLNFILFGFVFNAVGLDDIIPTVIAFIFGFCVWNVPGIVKIGLFGWFVVNWFFCWVLCWIGIEFYTKILSNMEIDNYI